MNPQISLGSSLPGWSPFDAMNRIMSGFSDPAFGLIGHEKAQVCPQNYGAGTITIEMLERLQLSFPDTRFRLHANVRILNHGCQYDLGTTRRFPEFTEALVTLLRFLQEPYSIHAANNGTPLKRQYAEAGKLSDMAGVPVAIEGLYPSRRANTLSTWKDYESLLSADVLYALDLSHLNIVHKVEGPAPQGLVDALVANPRCIEVHLSGNDGVSDRHLPCMGDEWWIPHLAHIHSDAVVFYEGRIH
ncbi:hypothetical protein NRY68_05775 [Acidithiobacillus ferrooxidans]|jgi:hypothetical protein|uniref:hypothetical protein n=1 Tax=Acidithiobacillus ferrooxidans TaxID=920 RepID=UPI00214915A5|nr:hypothetical protein [Acidithiobacillus ferrooxidans]MCR1345315.1 hypothetical protein [Acidithiobacillus ferrooxidans]MCR1354475.1 hypothetical protein [Acidithiobacillus ferrooxidans]